MINTVLMGLFLFDASIGIDRLYKPPEKYLLIRLEDTGNDGNYYGKYYSCNDNLNQTSTIVMGSIFNNCCYWHCLFPMFEPKN